jgi:hypothetical protein
MGLRSMKVARVFNRGEFLPDPKCAVRSVTDDARATSSTLAPTHRLELELQFSDRLGTPRRSLVCGIRQIEAREQVYV